MVMPFLPNEADATYEDQAEPDSVDFEILLAGIGLTGVVSGCAVTESGTPAQTVDVAAGVVRVAGRQVIVDVDAGVAVSAADGTNPRIDLITSNLSGVIVVTAGTPAAEPVLPDIPATSVPLATLYVPANDNTHGDAQINDKRAFVIAQTVFNVKHYGATGDSSTDDTTAIEDAYAALSAAAGGEIAGTLYFPMGFYRHTGLAFADTVGLRFLGENQYRARLEYDDAGSGTITDSVKFTNCTLLNVEDIGFSAASGNTVTNLVQIETEPAESTQSVLFKRVLAQGGVGTTTNGFALGSTLNNDLSEVTFISCNATTFDNAAWIIGNGTQGNVLGIRAFGCEGRESAIGVLMRGAVIAWYGGTTIGNTTTDFKLETSSTHPVVVDGLRSEGSKQLWLCETSAQNTMPVTLSNIHVASYTESGGIAITHQTTAPLLLQNVTIHGGAADTAIILGGGSASFPARCTAINLSADSPQPFNIDPAVVNAGYYVTVIAYSDMDSSSTQPFPTDTSNVHPSHQLTVTSTATTTLDARIASYFRIFTTTDITTMVLNNGHDGQMVSITVEQDGSGGHTYAWPSNCNFAGGIGPINTTPSKRCIVTFIYSGAQWYEIGRMIEALIGGASEEAGAVTLDRDDSVVNMESTGGTRAVTLPDNADYAGKNYLIRRDGGNTVTVTRAGADTFDDAATVKTLASDGAAIGIFSIGDGEWKIVGIQGTVT